MPRKITTIFGLLIVLFGIGVLCYPSFANYWNQIGVNQQIKEYDEDISSMADEELSKNYQMAVRYNKSLSSITVSDPFSGETNIDLSGTEFEDFELVQDGAMLGYVDIPAINVYLPFYFGASNDVLEKGAGLVNGTSIPIGGSGTHAVISAHTGLASRKYFTDLTELKEGDEFQIHILGQNLTYRVDQIKVVLPEDSSDLQIVRDKDYVTLLTCTPFGVNDHRLLVRGERVKAADTESALTEAATSTNNAAMDSMSWIYILLAIVFVLGVVGVGYLIVSVIREKL